jgi:hypothetical protein
MTQIRCQGRTAFLSYSTNVHPAESLDELTGVLKSRVAPISRAAFGAGTASVNLRLGMKQADEILAHPPLPSTSYLSDEILQAPPSPACQTLLDTLDEHNLDVVSINAFPIRDFYAPRVKEQVYSPPWTDGGRALYSLKIAKALTHFMARPGVNRQRAAISVPAGVFKSQYGDAEDVRIQCAHFITECVRELLRLERLTGRTVQLGLEPEPLTTAETCAEMIAYHELILNEARQKFSRQLQMTRAQAEEVARRFVTINLDLCHQAVEFEDPLDDLKKLQAAGVPVSGLHLSAALSLKNTADAAPGLARLKALDEPRYLHQVVARSSDGSLARFADLPDLWNPRRLRGKTLSEFNELRCHFHVPLFAEMTGDLTSTRDSVGPAARHALAHGLTDNFVVETYTWSVLAGLAEAGSAGARAVVGEQGAVDIHAGIVKELQWAQAQLTEA